MRDPRREDWIHAPFRRVHADASVSIFLAADSGVTREQKRSKSQRAREKNRAERSCEVTRIRKVVEVGSTANDGQTDFRIILKRRQRRLIDISMGPP